MVALEENRHVESRPVVLDTDGSVGALPAEIRLILNDDWREAVRYGCRIDVLNACMRNLESRMPAAASHGTVFLGSGDFHHLSLPLVQRCARRHKHTGLRVVVLDNHPDNMRFPWGIHCGSWIHHVARIPEVVQVHVIGITSGDLGLAHAWEHKLGSLLTRKISYWSTGVDTRWARWLGLRAHFHSFRDRQSLILAASTALGAEHWPTYCSIDKDVLSQDEVQTNWDQGVLHRADVAAIIDALQGCLVGSDVTGDISMWRYRTAWKRWLSTADGQDSTHLLANLRPWQARQNALNWQLLQMLDAAR
ncbi:arginase family protein [Achromobacter insuavis]|uniref:arginase family protein n=1 Tax=Achromobacter insuavis TaxID=1287735 RepID=UPI000AAEA9DC|nr:arginase family protein [Achromobacter insuavis]